MKEELDRLHLTNRMEAILRTDRYALRQFTRGQTEPPLLLTLVSDSGMVQDFFDTYIPEIAEEAGLRYVRLIASGLLEIPRQYLQQTFLVLADLTGRDEHVVTLVYQSFGSGRRVLLAVRDPQEIPPDLAEVPQVLYDLSSGDFRDLLRAVAECAGDLSPSR